MFIFGNILIAIAKILDLLFNAYQIILIAYCLVSWVNPDPYNQFVKFLRNMTEPVLWRVRKYLPFTYMKGLDLSPLVVLLLLHFLNSFLVSTLIEIGFRLR